MKITIRTCDDWVAVYKDGQRVWDNHSCSLRDGLEALGIEFEYINLDDQMAETMDVLLDGSDPFPESIDV